MRSLSTRLIGAQKRRIQEIEDNRLKLNSLVDILKEMGEHWVSKGYYRTVELNIGTERMVHALISSFYADIWDTPLAFNLMLEYFEDKYPELEFKEPVIEASFIRVRVEYKDEEVWFPPIGLYFIMKQNCEIIPKKETVTYEKTTYDYVCK